MKKYLLIVLFCSLGVSGYALMLGQTEQIQPLDSNECPVGTGIVNKTITVDWGSTYNSVSTTISCHCRCPESPSATNPCKWETPRSVFMQHPHYSEKNPCHAIASCTGISYRGCTGGASASNGSGYSGGTPYPGCIEGETTYKLCGSLSADCGTETLSCPDGLVVHTTGCQYLTKPTGPGSGAGSVIGTTPISGGETIGGVSSSTSAVSGGTTGSAGTTGSSTAVTQQQGAQQNTTQSQGY